MSVDDRQRLVDFNESVFSHRVFEARESRLRKALASFEQEPGRGELLDVAAGSGLAAEALAAQGWNVTALDLSPELVAQIRARPGVHRALQHDLSSGSFPFDDASMAAVFAGEIIEHLVDTRRFLDEIHRVLRPGGLLVVTTPNLASFENRVRLLFGVYPAWLEYELSSQGHVRAYTKRTLRTHLRATGLRRREDHGQLGAVRATGAAPRRALAGPRAHRRLAARALAGPDRHGEAHLAWIPLRRPRSNDKPASYYQLERADLVAELPTPIGRALDVGCGEGGVGRSLRAAGASEVHGVELVRGGRGARAGEPRQRRASSSVEAALASDALPGPFDTICCYDVLEHLVDPQAVLVGLRAAGRAGRAAAHLDPERAPLQPDPRPRVPRHVRLPRSGATATRRTCAGTRGATSIALVESAGLERGLDASAAVRRVRPLSRPGDVRHHARVQQPAVAPARVRARRLDSRRCSLRSASCAGTGTCSARSSVAT